MSINLFSTTQVARYMGIDGLSSIPSDQTDYVTETVNSIISRVERYTHRYLAYSAAQTEYVRGFNTVQDSRIYLRRRPVVSLTSVTPRSLTSNDYPVADALTVSKIYIDADNGILIREDGNFAEDTIYKVVYAGGYDDWQASASNQNSGTTLPDDLAMAILRQFRYEYENRNSIGIKSQSTGDESITKVDLIDGWLPEVQDVLAEYRLSWLT